MSIGVWRLSTVDGLKLEELKEARRGDCRLQRLQRLRRGEEERRMGEGSSFAFSLFTAAEVEVSRKQEIRNTAG